MVRLELPGATTPLPVPEEGWADLRYAILADGALGILRVPADLAARHHRWRPGQDQTPLWTGPARLLAFDGWAEGPAIDVVLETTQLFDRMSDGRWLTAAHRARQGEANGRLHAADSSSSRSLVLGDAIEHMRCGPDETFWVGYFDEGIGSGEPSNAGIARFSAGGKLLWGLNRGGAPWMLDCYSLTLDGDRLWSCYYPDFPIVRMDGEGSDVWINEDSTVGGVRALAVDGDHVLLAGTYDNPTLVSLLKLGAGGSHVVAQTEFEALRGRAIEHVQGRGQTLHVIGAGQWTRLDVHEVRQAVERHPRRR